MLIADRIAKTDQLAHAALLAALRVAAGELNAGSGEFLQRILEGHPSYRFPAYIGETVDLTGVEGKTMAAIVDLEIKRIGVALGTAADSEAHDVWTIVTPLIEFSGFEAHVTDADYIHENSPLCCSRFTGATGARTGAARLQADRRL